MDWLLWLAALTLVAMACAVWSTLVTLLGLLAWGEWLARRHPDPRYPSPRPEAPGGTSDSPWRDPSG